MPGKFILTLFKESYREWVADKASRLGAALAYYTIFSIAPLLLIATAVAGLVFGKSASEGQLQKSLEENVGPQAAQAIQGLLTSASKPSAGIIASVIGLATLILGASALFIQLKGALNSIWNIDLKPGQGFKGFVTNYLLSFLMVIGVGFVLLLSIIVSTALATIGKFFNDLLPGGAFVWGTVNNIVSFVILMVLFALIFKYVPDAIIRWKDVWPGAAVTAFLFTAGKWGLSMYLSRGSMSSTYGAAASLVVLLVWVYYSSQIIFFGAEFAEVYAHLHGIKIKPKRNAMYVAKQ